MNPLKKELKKVKHTYDKNDIKSFYNNMLGSNWYKDRLINNGYGITEPSSGKLETQIVKKLMPTSMMTSNVNALIKERKDTFAQWIAILNSEKLNYQRKSNIDTELVFQKENKQKEENVEMPRIKRYKEKS